MFAKGGYAGAGLVTTSLKVDAARFETGEEPEGLMVYSERIDGAEIFVFCFIGRLGWRCSDCVDVRMNVGEVLLMSE